MRLSHSVAPAAMFLYCLQKAPHAPVAWEQGYISLLVAGSRLICFNFFPLAGTVSNSTLQLIPKVMVMSRFVLSQRAILGSAVLV